MFPALKWLKGDCLTRDHWHELFHIIGLAKEVRLENLTFGHLLSVASNIGSKSDHLKQLNQRAQAEVVVREALDELEMWSVGAVFNLTEYKDGTGEIVYLVKDWNELVTQVGQLKQNAFIVWEKKLFYCK